MAKVRSGLRVPGAWDAFELAVRAMPGQQVTVSAASTLTGRLAATFGQPLTGPASGGDLRVVFPDPKALAYADLSSLGIPGARAAAISGVVLKRRRDPNGYATRAHAYFSGDLNALNGISVDCGGTPFEEQVWKALRTIPPGTTTTYRRLAEIV